MSIQRGIKKSDRVVKNIYTKEKSVDYLNYDIAFKQTDSFKEYHKYINDICNLFEDKIDALDLGCGTGRYFSCLSNVNILTGVDLSEHMLATIKFPSSELKGMSKMKLICKSIHDCAFEENTFNFIYSIGLFGACTPITTDLLNKVDVWLKDQGQLFMTVVDKSSFQDSLHPVQKVKEKFKSLIKKAVNFLIKEKFIDDFSLTKNYLTKTDLEKLIGNSSLKRRKIEIMSLRDTKFTHHVIMAKE